MIESAGLAVILNKKILLVKPKYVTKNNLFSIPKGIIEKNESYIDAAIRETKEETGINISLDLIDTKNLYKIYYINRGKITKKLFYYFANISSLNVSEILPLSQIQLKEIQYAAFFSKDEAKSIIFWRQNPILYQF